MSFTKPDWPKHLPNEGVLGLATLGPIGLRMKAPGTWGSAAGVLFFVVCFFPLSLVENLLASLVLGYLAVGICGEAEVRMGKRDPGMIAGSGFLSFICLLGAGFGLFRFYDIKKPLGIFSLQSLPGGWGVVVDDTAAALATCATLHLAHALWALIPSRG